MEPELKDEVAGSIPHMHLFMYLKRKFPALKDADITDVIQRFGLDKIRCEDELSRRNQEEHQGYNSPWNRSRTSSRGSLSSRNSPLSPSETHSYTSSPLQNGSSPSTPTSSQPHYCVNQCFSSSDKENFTPLYKNSPQSGETKGTYTCVASTKDSCTLPDLSHWNYSSTQVADSGCGRSSNGGNFPEEKSSTRRKSSESRIVYPGEKSPEPHLAHERPSLSRTISPQHNMSPPINPASSDTTNANAILPTVDGEKAQNSIPAAIEEQLARKQRLKDELNCQMGEKMKMENDVKTLVEELKTREASQKLDVIRSKKEIELIQQENSKLQFICDEMEREILESGESPKTDQEGRTREPPLRLASSPNDSSTVAAALQEQTHRIPLQQPLPRANSTSSLSSGGVGSPTTPLIPARKAPSPPGTARSPTASAGRNFEQVTQRPATIGSDESRKEWSCSKCTFINSPYLNVCEICGFPHFSVGTPPHLPSQPHPPNPGGPCYCHHRRHLSQGQENRNAISKLLTCSCLCNSTHPSVNG